MTTDYEVRRNARALYILEGCSLEEVAKATGVPMRTVESWSAAEGWVEQRREYREAQDEIEQDTMLLRRKLIKQAMESLDPQAIYAIGSLEAVASRMGKGSPRPVPGREIRTPDEAADALLEAVEHKINLMLADPSQINLGAVRDTMRAAELVKEMRAGAGQDENEAADALEKIADAETIRQFRKKFL